MIQSSVTLALWLLISVLPFQSHHIMIFTYFTLNSYGSSFSPSQNNGQQVSLAQMVSCYHLHVAPVDSSCLYVFTKCCLPSLGRPLPSPAIS